MSQSDPVVIVGMARTPMGGLMGDLSTFSANELGAIAVKAAVEEAKLGPEEADEIIMGNCLPAGQGQAPARQTGFKAGQDKGLEATTINKMCGSGLQAAVMARNAILAGDAGIVIAGGMESMTNAPHLLDVRQGHKYGDMNAKDHMALDGLTDAYAGTPMGLLQIRLPGNISLPGNSRTRTRWRRWHGLRRPLKTANSSVRLRLSRSKPGKVSTPWTLTSCRGRHVRIKSRSFALPFPKTARLQQPMRPPFPMGRLRLF